MDLRRSVVHTCVGQPGGTAVGRRTPLLVLSGTAEADQKTLPTAAVGAGIERNRQLPPLACSGAPVAREDKNWLDSHNADTLCQKMSPLGEKNKCLSQKLEVTTK